MPTIYEGNWPTNVSKDSKYSIRTEDGKYVVGIEYRTMEGEKWYPTSDEHDQLVDMVNKIKIEISGAPGGSFYINEYRHVIVPAGNPLSYYYAGKYTKDLIFNFNDKKISGNGVGLNGKVLSPDDPWEGPHQGIPYKLKAGAQDISYDKNLAPKVTKEITLSECAGQTEAKKLISRISSIVGFQGGRFYINEYRQLFTGMPYRYIGELKSDDPWFPEPHQD